MAFRYSKAPLRVAPASFILALLALSGFSRQSGKTPEPVRSTAAGALSGEPAGRQGYLLNFEMRDGRMRLQSAAEIDNYMENKHLVAEDDWTVVLFDDAEHPIGSRRVGNPGRHSPIFSAAQPLPLTAKVPHLQGLSAIGLYNQYEEEQLRISIDSAFRAQAAASRRMFLAHDRETRRLMAEASIARGEEAATGALDLRRVARIEDISEDLQNAVHGEIVGEIERLEQFGTDIMELHKALRIEPENAYQPADSRAPTVPLSAAAPGIYQAAAAYVLSGKVSNMDTGNPVAGAILDFYQYDSSNQYKGYIGRQTTDPSGSYSIAVDAGIVRIQPDYTPVAGIRYVKYAEAVTIDGPKTWNIRAIPGFLLSGTLTNSQNQGISGANIQAYSKDLHIYVNAPTSSGGNYSAVMPANRPLNITVSTPIPYTPPPGEFGVVFAVDTIRNFKAETGWLITGAALAEDGAPLSRVSVLLRQLAFTTTGSPYWYATTDTNGKYAFAVPKNLQPNSFILAGYIANYALQCTGLVINGDATLNLQMLKANTVSGTVRDSSEKAVGGIRVRAYRGGTFAGSALTASSGAYAFDLPAGAYDIEAFPAVPNTLAPALAKNVVLNGARTLNFVLPPASGILTIKLYFPTEEAYNRFSNRNLVRFEFYQSGLTVYAGSGALGSGGLDPANSRYFRPYTVYIQNGTYAMTAFIAGCSPVSLPEVNIPGPVTISVDTPSPFVWTGILRGADGKPLPGMTIQSFTDLARESEVTSTDASGRFSILLTPNGFAKFYANAQSNNILRTEKFGNVTAGRNEDVILDPFPPVIDSGAPLSQIFGVSDRSSRWNIVMIGDGYTGVNETYTDTNGNGHWDGTLYYDLNKNGAWDSGEPYQRYGNAAAPVLGTDPTTQNEPFTDLNGDGTPNLYDQSLFDLNTLDTARSLFGQDQWLRHRDAFNIFRIRLVSRQAGHKVMDKDRNVVIDRDTALGTFLDTPERSYLFNANYALVTQYINQYVPECDTRIVMVNQPIRMGRVNSYMFQYGGEISTLSNDYVVAHEMGHNVGLLADEYTEYQETYRGSESAARNVTSLTDPALIPWRHLIAPGKEIPSVPGSRGVGLYEGASYYTGGRYRPTEFCMMVSGNRYCPVCASEIEVRLGDITGVVPDARPRGPFSDSGTLYPEFKWDPQTGVSHYLLEIEKADGGQLVAAYDVYGTSFILPFALNSGTEYRWRIRPGSPGRFGSWSLWSNFRPRNSTSAWTGVFAQIAAGGGYQTILTGINTGSTAADVLVSLVRSDGTPLDNAGGVPSQPAHLNITPMGTARIGARLEGGTAAGYAHVSSNVPLDGTALFKMLRGDLILSEAGVGLSKPAGKFIIYIDNTGNANSGYAVANSGASPATLTLTLRDKNGATRETTSFAIPPGQHVAEFASQRFKSTAAAGFEGSIEFSSDQNVAAVALRYDNVHLDTWSQVFSTIPVLVDEAAKTLYFPQIADGGGYRTNLILMNPLGTATNVKLEFFKSDGTPMSLSIGGTSGTSVELPLNSRGVARLLTDGTGGDTNVGWVKATSSDAVIGSLIFQTRDGSRIVSEAGVASSPLTRHFTTYVESLGTTESGVAICNPNDAPVTLTLNLRRSTGEIDATVTLTLPARGHVAKFFTQWLPRGFSEFEGTLEVVATAPVSAVALRYDNPAFDVFATLPVVMLP